MAAMRGLLLSLSPRAGMISAMALVVCVGCRSEPQEAPALRAQPAAPPPADSPQPAPPPPAAERQSAVPRAYAGPLPPLPQVPYPPARPPEMVQAVYAFAARNPEVLHYVPCFCGCEHHGHQGSDDCFVAGRDGDGKPRWEMHGYG
jgi:hypothetical protein